MVGLTSNHTSVSPAGSRASSVMAAIISFFSGLILKSIDQNERQRFELELYDAMRREREETA